MGIFVDELAKKYNETKIDDNLRVIRNENHALYYKLDIDFLNTVDLKYKNFANNILDRYKRIISNSILVLNLDESYKLNAYLKSLSTDITKLKKVVRNDLNTVIDYVDRLFEKVDVSTVTKDTPLGILILNKYDALKIYSANINLSDLNGTMKRQSKRMMYLKELDYLITNYKNNNSKYNGDNTRKFINNLYEIVGRYLFLLTSNEFEYTKEAIKKILAYKFDFIDKYIPTYKMILTKIWNSDFTGDYYFVCNLDLDKNNIYLMNENNIDRNDNFGYICDVPKDFIGYFEIDSMDLINYPLPCNLNDKYEVCKKDNVNLKAIYTTKGGIDFKSILPVVKIEK